MSKPSKPSRSSGLRGIAAPSDAMSVSIRKTENGFLVRRSGTVRGRYVETERYSATDPLAVAKGSASEPRGADTRGGARASERRR